MSEFKTLDDFSHRTEAPTSVNAYDSLDGWIGANGIRIMDGKQCIEINTRDGAIALRDWLTKAIGDNGLMAEHICRCGLRVEPTKDAVEF